MNHRSEPAIEITPGHWIEPPVFNEAGKAIPSAVTEANEKAAREINQHKETFLKLCLDCLFSTEDIGEAELKHVGEPEKIIPALLGKLDPAKFQLTLRNDHSPVLALPSQYDPHQQKQKGHVRQTGHTLTLNYDGRWVGTMEIQYASEGKIGIQINTREDP